VVRTVGNGIAPLAASARESPPSDQHTLVYLGRSDVEHKGLDRLMAIAKELPETQLRMYGDGLERIGWPCAVPHNVRFMGVVADAAKVAALTGASCYVHMSRWEGYGRSIVEAMGLAVPVAISADCDLAELVRRRGLGLVLEDADDPVRSAHALRRFLGSPLAEQCAQRARNWALSDATPTTVAYRIAEAYASVSTAKDAVPARRDRAEVGSGGPGAVGTTLTVEGTESR
jgi:glycosyltransferase involved in cell wall biosynthesis